MIILITGDSHTGKTNLAQKMLEKYHYPYLSIDHLKMGLIRSNQTKLTPCDSDESLTNYLWPIVVEIIKTAIENKQNLIVEGVYIPSNYKQYFTVEYLENIKYYCLVFSKEYINYHYEDIVKYSNVIENRLVNDLDKQELIENNNKRLKECIKYNNEYILIEKEYKIEI